ncbi:hypothetical protein GJ699_02735 [Duganella sp. FT80W]|uniref:Uncharacterized protein n=1 Tax=Duganella guangzhouensis TaxID=2666084 RepID=A0A6I2KT22_9BURK|nr:hypothetical protein [Duganella guangzhouensis]MRW88893.1 hypothetical protein [Duganella guangzhouensis]
MRFTTKGVHWVAGEFAKHQLAEQMWRDTMQTGDAAIAMGIKPVLLTSPPVDGYSAADKALIPGLFFRELAQIAFVVIYVENHCYYENANQHQQVESLDKNFFHFYIYPMKLCPW